MIQITMITFTLSCLAVTDRAGSQMEITTEETDELLANPGMGWQTFHRFADGDKNLEGLPSSSAYFRLYWREVEPVEGEIDFARFDELLANAKKAGQKLAFRIMCAGTSRESIYVPEWLRDKGCPGFDYQYQSSGKWYWVPDMDNPMFLDAHLRLIAELGKRYDGHPDLDLVDIGSVGLWGEWHMSGTGVEMPSVETRHAIIDAYRRAFPKTPKVMLIGDVEEMKRATLNGCGWRADCLGDMGGFSKTWNHMEHFYRQQIQKCGAGEAWRAAPIAFESCWDMRKWKEEGWDIRFIFDYALDLHASYLNNKSASIPEGTRDEIERFLRKLGYRLVLRRMTHSHRISAGSSLKVAMLWENVGVAPPYRNNLLAFRITSESSGESSVFLTETSIQGWLPGKTEVAESLTIPENLEPGRYKLAVGVVEPSTGAPSVRLAINGRAEDGWYTLSQFEVVKPLALHPENPHYFLFRDEQTVLITSGEHYGAVLNLDFDYARYLDTLHADGLNLTRTFVGAYVEPQGAFNITRNTLAPEAGRFICPWARSDASGYANGGNKFDLSRWDTAYFQRLKDFVARASERGIVVEINLFCPFYQEDQWNLSPMNPINNVNELGEVSASGAYTLTQHGGLLAFQEAMVRKVVTELREFDNVYYEVMNEPYTRNIPREWEHYIADVIVETEKSFPAQHLISQNIANHRAEIKDPHPAVSIFNFHYASPPDTVVTNYALNKVIGENETGFRGTGDTPYRTEAWEFIMAGGGLYNNLDYSFAVGYEDGAFVYPATQPGGGTSALRQQLRILKDFIHSFDFVRMRPDPTLIRGGLPEGTRAWALIEPGQQYALYLYGGGQADLTFSLPAGDYGLEWISPITGEVLKQQRLSHRGGDVTVVLPGYDGEIALRMVRH